MFQKYGVHRDRIFIKEDFIAPDVDLRSQPLFWDQQRQMDTGTISINIGTIQA